MRRRVLPLVALLLLSPLTLAAPAEAPATRAAAPAALAPAKDDQTPPHAPPFLAAYGGEGDSDCGSGADARSHDRPVNLTAPATCAGRIGEGDWYDWYRVELAAWTTLRVTLDPGPGARYACVTPDDDPYHHCVRGDASEPVRVSADVNHTGTYHVVIFSGESAVHDYAFHVASLAWDLPPECGAGDAGEPPMTLATGAACTGSLNPRDDAEDRFAFHLPAGQGAAVRLLPNPDADFDLCVSDAATGELLDCSIRSQGLLDVTHHSSAGALDLLVSVHVWSGAGPYELRIDPSPAQDDCGLGGDGGSAYHAPARPMPLSCEGLLAPQEGDRFDLYAVTLTEPGVHLDVVATQGRVSACLWNAADGLAYVCATSLEGAFAQRDFLGVDAGLWYVGVRAWDDAAGYALGLSGYTPPSSDDCGTGADAPWSGPVRIAAPIDCRGALTRGDTADRFVFHLPEGTVRVRLDSNATPVLCVHSSCRRVDNGTAEVNLTAEAGDRQVTIHAPSGVSGDYRLVVTHAPPFDDCGAGGDAGDRPEDARLLVTPVLSCEGRFRHLGDGQDHYAVEVPPGHAWALRVEGPPGMEVCFHEADGDTCFFHFGLPFDELPHVRGPALEGGLRRFWVGAPSTQEQAYFLSVVVTTDAVAPLVAPTA